MSKALKIICFCLPVLLLGIPSLAQNTKGDRPAPTTRDTRFKTPKNITKRSTPPRRVRHSDDKVGKRAGAPPVSTRTGKGGRVGRPIGGTFSKSQPRQNQQAWKGDFTGRRITPRTSSGRAHNVYPQPDNVKYSSLQRKRRLRDNENPNVKRVQRMQRDNRGQPRVGRPIRPTFHKSHPRESQRAWKGDIAGRPVRARKSDNVSSPPSERSMLRVQPGRTPGGRNGGQTPAHVSARARNIFSLQNFYVSKQSRQRPVFRDRGNPSLSLNPNQRRPGVKDHRIVPRSASASFMRRRSINTWAHFRKPGRRHAPFDRDLAGRKLRGKNYETRRPELTNPTWNYQRRVAQGERPYKGPAGGYQSRTQSGRAWRGDVAHRAIRGGQPPRGRESAFPRFLKGGGFRSATVQGGKKPGRPLFGRAPGVGAKGIGNYRGNIRVNERRGFGDQGEAYTGNIRRRRILTGGGSVSGRVWNNKGVPIQGKMPGNGSRGIGYTGNIRIGKKGFNDQGEEYTGSIKGRRGFNQQGEEYRGNMRVHGRPGFDEQGERYTGNLKARRPDKGGGSRSGHWNNNNTPIMVRIPKGRSAGAAGYQGDLRIGERGFNDQGEAYTGNIKARRPDKSGGSVSGKLWNNNERPISGKYYAGQTKISRYSGNIKANRPEKGGGSVSGELWNNDERPLPGKDYSYAKKMSRYSGDMKAKKADKGENGGFDFSGNARLARNDYKRNPNSAEEALKGRRASAAALKADIAVRGSRKSWDYIKNPSSADDAQRTREPGRAFVRSTEFHGDMRVRRVDRGKQDLHPDAKFVKLNKNNVPEEKDMFTNFKLWWARFFRKNETQPDHLKEKEGKPRYDKGEAGMWYE